MTDNTINEGGEKLFLTKQGTLSTVVGNNTYKLKKAIELEFDLAPEYELLYDDDLGFDPTPNGDLGTWATEMPATSDMVSTASSFAIPSESDRQTFSYWLYELANKRFPGIQFREILKDSQATPKVAPFNFIGFLTRVKFNRVDGESAFTFRLEGLIKQYLDFKRT